MQSFLSVRCSFFCYGHNSFIVFFPYFYHLYLYVSYFYQQENHPTQTFSTPVKISEKSTLDLKRLAHVIELDIPSKAIIHYPISSSFVLFGIISIFNDFFIPYLVLQKISHCPTEFTFLMFMSYIGQLLSVQLSLEWIFYFRHKQE